MDVRNGSRGNEKNCRQSFNFNEKLRIFTKNRRIDDIFLNSQAEDLLFLVIEFGWSEKSGEMSAISAKNLACSILLLKFQKIEIPHSPIETYAEEKSFTYFFEEIYFIFVYFTCDVNCFLKFI